MNVWDPNEFEPPEPHDGTVPNSVFIGVAWAALGSLLLVAACAAVIAALGAGMAFLGPIL